jgi:hypothetical protein
LGALATAYVDIGADIRPMQSQLSKARASLKSFAAKGATVAIGALGTAGPGIAAGLFAAAKKAADLGESVSKVRTAFGRDAEGMIAQADQLAEKFGVVKQATLDAGAGFGLMGRAAGLSTAAAANLGSEFVKLGLDLASFHNMSNEEAFEKLRSGLAGETEPLRPLGIMLSEDAVKAEALAMGLTKVKRELSDQEKILARVSLIRKQAGPAVGDFERTIENNTPQLRKLEGELSNAATEFGTHLQDSLRDGIKLAHEFADIFKGIMGKSPAEWVGGATNDRINGARMTMQLGPGFLLRDWALQAADAVGLGRAGPLAEGNRQHTEAGAAAIGLPLTAPPIPWMANGLGFDPAKRAAERKRQDAEILARNERDAKRAEEAAANRRGSMLKTQDEATKLGQTLGFDPMTQQILGGNFTGALARGAEEAKQAQEARTNRHNMEVERKARESPFQSQSFASGGDFARFAIEKALSSSSGEDDAKKQTQLQQDMAGALGKLNAIAETFLQKVDSAPPLRAILRGAS